MLYVILFIWLCYLCVFDCFDFSFYIALVVCFSTFRIIYLHFSFVLFLFFVSMFLCSIFFLFVCLCVSIFVCLGVCVHFLLLCAFILVCFLCACFCVSLCVSVVMEEDVILDREDDLPKKEVSKSKND